MKTIFGKEPIFWVGVVQAVLALLLTIAQARDSLNLSDERAAQIIALLFAVSAVYEAWTARDTMLAAVTGLGKAVVALLAAYGLELSPETVTAGLGLLALATNAIFLRSRTSPLVDPSLNNGPNAPVLTQPELARGA